MKATRRIPPKLAQDVSSTSNNLWLKWINHVYLKDGNLWEYKVNANTNLFWRQLVMTRDVLRNGFNIISARWNGYV